MKRVLIILIAMISFFGGSAKAATPADEANVKKFVGVLYTDVLVKNMSNQDLVNKYFNSNLKDLYKMVEGRDSRKHGGDIGCFDYNFWLNTQDTDDNFKLVIKSVKFEGNGVATVHAFLRGKYQENPVSLRLVKSNNGWKISDINGIAKVMRAYLVSD